MVRGGATWMSNLQPVLNRDSSSIWLRLEVALPGSGGFRQLNAAIPIKYGSVTEIANFPSNLAVPHPMHQGRFYLCLPFCNVSSVLQLRKLQVFDLIRHV